MRTANLLCEILGVEYYNAIVESDKLLCILNNKISNSIISTNDSDILAHGAICMI